MKTLSASQLVTIAACASTVSLADAEKRAKVAQTTFLSKSSLLLTDSSSLKAAIAIPRGGEKSGKNSKTPSKSSSQKSSPSKKKKQRKKGSSLSSSKDDPKDDDDQNDASTPKTNPMVEEILQHDDFYQVLGVLKEASETQIKKAYRKRAVQTHPDKTGGDRRAFDKVSEAYDALSDESKRQVYDRFGKAGLENGGGGAGGMHPTASYQDMFRNMFQQQQQARERRNHTVRYQLEVTLEDLFNGMTQNVIVAPPNTNTREKQKQNQKRVEVHIPKGAISGQSIVMSGEMDFANGTPGDLVFILTQVPHPVFTRKGHDLAMELTISLEEAICGLQRSIKHLDGSNIRIQSAYKGEIPIVVETGDIQVLKGRGMPKKNQSDDEFGDLYIQYRVEMPKAKGGTPLSAEELQELRRLLSKLQGKVPSKNKKETANNSETEICLLQPASTSDFGRASGSIQLDDEDQYGQGEDEYHPFASNFFQGANTRGSSFYFGSNLGGGGSPFGGSRGEPDPYGGGDDGNVQCQQM